MPMMTMEQLVEATGTPERSIRAYIRAGVVPNTAGAPGYDEIHVVYLLTIARLREEGVRKHDDFRARIAAMSPEELEDFAYMTEGDDAEAGADAGPMDGAIGVTTEAAAATPLARHEGWTRIVLRPGLELHRRGGEDEEVQRLAGEIEARYGAAR